MDDKELKELKKQLLELEDQGFMGPQQNYHKKQRTSDPKKFETVIKWPTPTNVCEVCEFVGFCQFPRRFVKDFSKIVAPLTEITQGNSFQWTERQEETFECLKVTMCSTPTLKIPDFTKPFEVHTDASDGAIDEVLMQEGQPVAYESHKFSDVEMRWTTHGKEMMAVVYCLRKWRHYVQDKHTQVYTDNVSLKYFQTQPKLTPKQARWQDFLVEYDIEIIHKPGKHNVMPDALSCQPNLNPTSTIQGTLKERIIESQKIDPAVIRMMNAHVSGKSAIGLFDIRDGLFYAHSKIYIPNDPTLKKDLLWEAHDCKLAGHGGQKRSFDQLHKHYFWPKMQDEVIEYVRTCPTCQLVKAQRIKPAGLLKTMSVPSCPWDMVSMDFITNSSMSHGYKNIMVVVDYFSKQAHFILAPQPLTAYQIARLYFTKVFKYHGLPPHHRLRP
ncbi:hypothetical protein L7F22_028899 [Adiantum nelumboides]|nr:hypothetical protein [Adiantum nelumboides]